MSKNRSRKLSLCQFEQRDVPAVVTVVVENEPNNSAATYQPLNKGTTYEIRGAVASIEDKDHYSAWFAKDSNLELKIAVYSQGGNFGDALTEVALYSPSGERVLLIDDRETNGDAWNTTLTHKTTERGAWRVAIGYNSFPNQSGGEAYFRRQYRLTLSGASEPEIVTKDPELGRRFLINGNNPKMPEVPFELIGVTPDPGTKLDVKWTTRVKYVAKDFPAVRNTRGPGRDLPLVNYDVKEVNDNNEFQPDFMIGTDHVLAGGRLLLTAETKVAGENLTVKSKPTGPKHFEILGDNPDLATVHNYVASLAVPANWPTNTSYNFHAIFRKMIFKESGAKQFSNAIPLWSLDTLKGVGMMQITKPKPPTPAQTWDWRKNIDAGVALFGGEKLKIASNKLTSLFNRIQGEADRRGAVAAPITGDMIVLQAIRGYNGYDNGAGIKNEWRAVRNSQYKLVLESNQTIWERVPVGERGTKWGEPDYVNKILNTADF